MITAMIHFISFVVESAMRTATISNPGKVLLCIFPNFAMGYAS